MTQVTSSLIFELIFEQAQRQQISKKSKFLSYTYVFEGLVEFGQTVETLFDNMWGPSIDTALLIRLATDRGFNAFFYDIANFVDNECGLEIYSLNSLGNQNIFAFRQSYFSDRTGSTD